LSKKAQRYNLELTKREFEAVRQTLNFYVMDCAIHTKTLAAVERVLGKINKEAIKYGDKEP
jgi:hypothetical protein